MSFELRRVGEFMPSRFRNLPEIAYSIYTAAVTLSLGSALFVYYRLSQSLETLPGEAAGQTPDSLVQFVQYMHWSAILVAATMVCGLVFVIPLIKYQSQNARNEEKRANKLQVEAITDPLTGLYNRRYFEEVLKEFLAEFNRIDRPLGLLIMDLDHFKSINDTHGHDVGDIVLKEVAILLRQLTREHDIVARIGGEEFAVIAPFASSNQIVPFAERFCKMIGELKININNVVIRPTVSIGVSISNEQVNSEHAMMKEADKRLYEAKHRGRNQVVA